MIVSKANLQVVHTTKVDKAIPAIDNVHIAGDGSTVGVGGKMMLVVSPVSEEIKLKLKNVVAEKGAGGISVSSDTVRSILKSIPPDRQFKGLLEHCNIEPTEGGEALITMSDGKRKKHITGKLYPRGFLPWETMMKDAMQSCEDNGKSVKEGNNAIGGNMRLVLNLKRLTLLLTTIEKVAPDTSGDNPVWIEFTKSNYIVIRGLNMITGQRVVGVMSPYEGAEGKWLELDEWEKTFVKGNKKVMHKKRPKLKIRPVVKIRPAVKIRPVVKTKERLTLIRK